MSFAHATTLRRFTGILLIFVIMLGLVPVSPQVRAEGPSLKLTNLDGEETSTFTVGEPIFVTASSDAAGDWVAMYSADYEDDSSYWFYYYVEGTATDDNDREFTCSSGDTCNIYDTIPGTTLKEYNYLPAGEYVIRLTGTPGIALTVTLEEPENEECSLETEKTALSPSEKLRYRAISYTDGSWVGLYSGLFTVSASFGDNALYKKYANGHNGEWIELDPLAQGDYTLVLFEDRFTSSPLIALQFSVASVPEISLVTDKTAYTYGQPIMVTATPGAPNRIALFKQSDTDITSPLFCLTAIRNTPVNLLSGEQHRQDEFIAGSYKVLLLDENDAVLASVENIVITAELDSTVTVEPTCDTDGYVLYTYTDGTVKTEYPDNMKATGHAWGKWSFNSSARTHSRICANGDHPETADCSFDSGVVTLKPTLGSSGAKTFTCSVCSGAYTETLPALSVTGERVVSEPTCTEPGSKVFIYSDGTQSAPVEIPATGHAWGKWSFNSSARTHSRICTNGDHPETADCSFDSGVVTLKPTLGSSGVKTFTCSVCSGTYTETLPALSVTGERVISEPTCTEPGSKVFVYSDGTQSAPVEIPATGHAWGKPQPAGNQTQHIYVCKNNSSHTKTEACTVETNVADGYETSLCTLCGYSHSLKLLSIAKTDYAIGESVTVTAHSRTDGSWVGLFRKGELPTPKNSLYSFFVLNSADATDRNGKETELTDMAFYNTDRDEKLFNGVYTVMLFGDSGCDNVLASQDITVYTDMSKTEFRISLDGEVLSPGAHREYAPGDIGVTAMLNLYVTVKGEAGASRVGIYRGLTDTETDHTALPCLAGYYISDQKPAGLDLFRELELTSGNYTVVIFEDPCRTKPLQTITVTITRAVLSEKTLAEATCVRPGSKQVVYSDDGDPDTAETVTVVIPALGHDMGLWTPVEATDTHSRICKRAGCGLTETSACTYENNECTVCGGTGHVHELSETAAKAPTCTDEGNITYFVCDCGLIFRDPEGTTPISPEETVIPAPGHSMGLWTYDGTGKHTRACENDPTHTETQDCTWDGGVIIREATATAKGLREFTCNLCGGKRTEDIEIPSGTFDRVYGATRYDTAIATANLLKAQLGVEKFSAIVVACGDEFADALSGSYLANVKNAPILLVRSRNVEQIKTYIRENLISGGTVYLLGGTKAVPAAMETGLEGFNVKRLSGATRYDTNLAILREAGAAGKSILVCTGKDFADGLSASAVGLPILLVKDSLSVAQAEFLASSFTGNELCIIGGTVAVNSRIENALRAYGPVSRIAGSTRYQTSAMIASRFFPKASGAVLAWGENFPDGLCGGTVAYRMGAPLLLVANSKEAPARDYAATAGIRYGIVLGGGGLISDRTAEKIFLSK